MTKADVALKLMEKLDLEDPSDILVVDDENCAEVITYLSTY